MRCRQALADRVCAPRLRQFDLQDADLGLGGRPDFPAERLRKKLMTETNPEKNGILRSMTASRIAARSGSSHAKLSPPTHPSGRP